MGVQPHCLALEREAVTWSWQVRARAQFDPGSLRVMLRATQAGETITAADLSQDVEFAARPPVIERFQTLLFGSVANSIYTAVFSALASALVGFWKGRKPRAPAMASEPRSQACVRRTAPIDPAGLVKAQHEADLIWVMVGGRRAPRFAGSRRASAARYLCYHQLAVGLLIKREKQERRLAPGNRANNVGGSEVQDGPAIIPVFTVNGSAVVNFAAP